MIWFPSMTICACSREMPSSNRRICAFWPRPMIDLVALDLVHLAHAARRRAPPGRRGRASPRRRHRRLEHAGCSSAGMQSPSYHNGTRPGSRRAYSDGRAECARELDQAVGARTERRDRADRVGDQRGQTIARRGGVLAVLGVGDVVGVLERDAVRGPEAAPGRSELVGAARRPRSRPPRARRGTARRSSRRAASPAPSSVAGGGSPRSRAWPRTMPARPAACASAARRGQEPLRVVRALARLARSTRTPASAARRRPGSRSLRRTPCGCWAGRGGSRRRPSPADRRGSASSSAPARPPRTRAARRRPRAPHRLGRGEREQRPDALARRQQRVAHRFEQAPRIAVGGRRQARRRTGGRAPRGAPRSRSHAVSARSSPFYGVHRSSTVFDFERRRAARRRAASRPSSRRRRGSPSRGGTAPSPPRTRAGSPRAEGFRPRAARPARAAGRGCPRSVRAPLRSCSASLAIVCRPSTPIWARIPRAHGRRNAAARARRSVPGLPAARRRRQHVRARRFRAPSPCWS